MSTTTGAAPQLRRADARQATVTGLSVDAAWAALAHVLDPEVPVLSVVELGIVRDIEAEAGRLVVTLTPTYSGCPATEVIHEAIRTRCAKPAPLTSPSARGSRRPGRPTGSRPTAAEKLRRYGIAPPHLVATGPAERPLHFHPRAVACPRCGSHSTEQLSAFGATACKSLYRCVACREPFEYFKPF